MKERLLKFLNTIQLSSSKFAEEIGIQPSGVSHILSGRNNPGYDFIVKILTRFPELNSEWLILGKGEMFRSSSKQSDLFDDYVTSSDKTVNVTNVKSSDPEPYGNRFPDEPSSGKQKKETETEKIVVFRKNGTFNEYFPG